MFISFGGSFFNFFGACTRWTLYRLKRIVTKEKPISFLQFLNGPEKSDDFFDIYGHELNNKWIGFITVVFLGFIIAFPKYILYRLQSLF